MLFAANISFDRNTKRKEQNHRTKPSQRMPAANIRVIVKFRPHNKIEAKADKATETKEKTDLKIIDVNTVQVDKKAMHFDHILEASTTQTDAFEAIAEKSCEDLLSGYNSTIFMYGQTGSGKTYSMYGDNDDRDIERMGIIPRCLGFIFEQLDQGKIEKHVIAYKLKISFLEIYNEQLKDLLHHDEDCPLRIRSTKLETYVEGLTSIEVTDISQVLKLINVANKNRVTEATNMNATSSRGHMLMQVDLWQKIRDQNTEAVETAKAYFADLAGSERTKKTGATGQRMKEAQNINLSLTVLGRTISALASKKKKVVPYRESKLTHILKDSLGGNCKTTLVITASTHIYNRDESVSTLKFGQRCKLIKTKAKINRIYTKNDLLVKVAQLERENEELRAMKMVSPNFDEAEMKSEKDEKLFAVQQELDDLQFSYNSERNVIEEVVNLLGFPLQKILDYAEHELLKKKCEEMGRLIKGLDEGHNRRESLLYTLDEDDVKAYGKKANYLNDAVANMVNSKEKKKKADKYWCWMDPDKQDGYCKYSETLSAYLDGMEKGEEENIRINDHIYLFCRTGKYRGYAEELKSKARLDLRKVTDNKMTVLNAVCKANENEDQE